MNWLQYSSILLLWLTKGAHSRTSDMELSDGALGKLVDALMSRIDLLEGKLEARDQAHGTEINKMRVAHLTAMDAIRRDFSAEIARKHEDYQSEMSMLRHDHTEEVRSLRDGYETVLDHLRLDLAEQTIRLEELESVVDLLRQDDINNRVNTASEKITKTQQPIIQRDVTSEKAPRAAMNLKNRIRRADNEMDVAFFATLESGGQHLGVDQDVAFDHVITNIGSSYNPHVGIFVAPVAGTYVFSVTLTTQAHDTSHFGLFRNTERMTVIWVNGAENSYDVSSHTAVLHLVKGDDVTIKSVESDRSLYLSSHCLFSGFLLSQDYSDSSGVIVGK